MEKYYITFRSVTYAQTGEKLLKKGGIHCFIERTPRWMESRGCGYAIRVTDPGKAVGLLKDGGAAYRKIYRVGMDRTPQEVSL